MDLPKETGAIFETLSKGQFICSNSSNEQKRRLFEVIEEHYDNLREYFIVINFILEKGNEYYYFSRPEITAELSRKIDAALEWIDIVDFFKTYDNSFGDGFRFTASSVVVKLNVDAVLKNKLESMKLCKSDRSYAEKIQKIINAFVKDDYIELESEIMGTYKVLSSFRYLEQLILSINIPEETIDEIPE